MCSTKNSSSFTDTTLYDSSVPFVVWWIHISGYESNVITDVIIHDKMGAAIEVNETVKAVRIR
jgi:hypothetical protein